MRLRKQCCYYCICGYIEKKKPLKVYCTAISNYVGPNEICNKFKKINYEIIYRHFSVKEVGKDTAV